MNDPMQQSALIVPSDPSPAPPIAGAPSPCIQEPYIPVVNLPHTSIPHMGTSKATLPHPPSANALPNQTMASHTTASDIAASQAMPLQATASGVETITKDAIDAAIRQVEQTGSTDGLSPQVLAAACQQIETQAAQQGIDLSQAQAQAHAQPQPQGPANYVEAAVLDKQGTFENFTNQRDTLKSAVAEQRTAAQRPYADALEKVNGSLPGATDTGTDIEAMKNLAAEMKALDPQTIALINAMGVLTHTPEVLKGIVWLEIIRAVRKLISVEAKHQIDACLNGDIRT